MTRISRREFVKIAGFGALAAASGVSLVGCGSSQGASGSASTSADGVRQVVVTMTPGSEPAAGFDPLVSWGCGEHVHEPLIQSTLIATDAELAFVNDLATSYECSEDGMTWTFQVRDDVMFTDGVALTAQDVAFTVNGIISSEASEADLSSVAEAVVVEPNVVELRMKRPNNALLYTLAVVGIVPAHAYGSDYGARPVGSGRYMLEQWDRGQQVILRANPDYYGEKPLMDRVVVLFMEEDASMAAAQAGEVDVAYTSASLAEHVPEGYALLNCHSVDSRGISLPCVGADAPDKIEEGVAYKVGNDVTCDIAVRRALNYGIDRDGMIEHVLNGYGTVAWSVGEGLPWASPDMKVDVDPDYARRLLEDAGWIAGGDGVRVKDGVRAAFDLYYSAGDSVRQALAADFADQCKGLGIEVTVKGASWDDIYPHQYSDPVLWGWGSNAPVELYELTHSEGWGNYASYGDPAIDACLQTAREQASVEDSYAYYRRAQWDPETGAGVAVQGASTWVWLANVDHLYFERDGLEIAKQKPHPHGHGWSLVNNVDRWSWNR